MFLEHVRIQTFARRLAALCATPGGGAYESQRDFWKEFFAYVQLKGREILARHGTGIVIADTDVEPMVVTWVCDITIDNTTFGVWVKLKTRTDEVTVHTYNGNSDNSTKYSRELDALALDFARTFTAADRHLLYLFGRMLLSDRTHLVRQVELLGSIDAQQTRLALNIWAQDPDAELTIEQLTAALS